MEGAQRGLTRFGSPLSIMASRTQGLWFLSLPEEQRRPGEARPRFHRTGPGSILLSPSWARASFAPLPGSTGHLKKE